MISIGGYHADLYYGAKLWRIRDWRMYGIRVKRVKFAPRFNIGPILFWKE